MSDLFQEILSMMECPLIPKTMAFECSICCEDCEPYKGVILHGCNHYFCRDCIINTINSSDEAEILCPGMESGNPCQSLIWDQEIRHLLDEKDYLKYQAKSLAIAEAKAGKESFHCLKEDCDNWTFYDELSPFTFSCGKCNTINCISCKAVHTGKTCDEYKRELLMKDNPEALNDAAALKELIENGSAMLCPTCGTAIQKVSGCDWLLCSRCKTEVCWATKGPRWGPRGKGDTSGGCGCERGVGGKLCHPTCQNCH